MVSKRKVRAKRTALIVDGSYARIQARVLGGKLDFVELRAELEELTSTEFEECWYFDSQRSDARGDSSLAKEYHALKFARPNGPQFQVKVFSTKPYNCHCTKCGHNFTQNVQKGVDNAIATKILELTTLQDIKRVVLLSGDGDFYPTLRFLCSHLRKEVWVVGFRGTVSGDLQQLSTKVVWVNDMWPRVKCGRGEHGASRFGRSERGVHHRSQRKRHSRRDQSNNKRGRGYRSKSRGRRRDKSPARSRRRLTYRPPSRWEKSPVRREGERLTSHRSESQWEKSPVRREFEASGRGLVLPRLPPSLDEVSLDHVTMSDAEDEDWWPCSPPSLSPPASPSAPAPIADPEAPRHGPDDRSPSLDGGQQELAVEMPLPASPTASPHLSSSSDGEQQGFPLVMAMALPASTTASPHRSSRLGGEQRGFPLAMAVPASTTPSSNGGLRRLLERALGRA